MTKQGFAPELGGMCLGEHAPVLRPSGERVFWACALGGCRSPHRGAAPVDARFAGVLVRRARIVVVELIGDGVQGVLHTLVLMGKMGFSNSRYANNGGDFSWG